MVTSFNRRDFFKSLPLAGISIAISGPEELVLPSAAGFTIKTKSFAASFDGKSGTFDVYRSDGTPLLTGARTTSCAGRSGTTSF
jgi:hypothetical protein